MPSPPRCFPAPPELRAERVLNHAKRIGVFEGFDGRVEGVGHVGVMAAGAVRLRRGSMTTGDGFVIGVGLAGARIDSTDGQVVHGAGACGGDAIGQSRSERTHERIDDALRGFDIAAGNGCGRTRVDDGARGSEDLDGTHEAGGGDGAAGQQAAEDIENGGPGDGVDRVDAAGNLRVGAGEVNDQRGGVWDRW